MQTFTTLRAIAISLALGVAALPAQAAPQPTSASVQMQHIRNATTKIDYAGKTFLVDPFLAKKDTYPGFEGSFRSHLRNPTVELPMSVEDVMKDVDAVIVTHTH
ncbi:MAG: MBL fold metallo-hydrolase, partial [Pseudomonadota bacterium]|nr:MBL fold metallo-hydrolase [Pseudomonadota bacterium]